MYLFWTLSILFDQNFSFHLICYLRFTFSPHGMKWAVNLNVNDMFWLTAAVLLNVTKVEHDQRERPLKCRHQSLSLHKRDTDTSKVLSTRRPIKAHFIDLLEIRDEKRDHTTTRIQQIPFFSFLKYFCIFVHISPCSLSSFLHSSRKFRIFSRLWNF